MRCPKCHYISFEASDRCRNCGYEFSLAPGNTGPTDLELNDLDEDPQAPIDLSLSGVEGLSEPRHASGPSTPFDIDRVPARPSSFDLPLFSPGEPAGRARHQAPAVRATIGRTMSDDASLVRPSPVPRPPLAVRRATPEASRLKSRYATAEAPRLDLDLTTPDFNLAEEPTPARTVGETESIPAPPFRRLIAGIIDLMIVGGINAGVLYFTLKLCGLPLSLDGLLGIPAAPMLGFLLLLDGGYAVTFTAAIGQTIGKMAMRLRVVHLREDDTEEDRPDFGFAILRTTAYFASLLPAGLGFLPALVGKDRRALHDRLAETRVVTM
jgi:uncharacterized RDD family membrane protein YckC